MVLPDRFHHVVTDADPFGAEGMQALPPVPAVVAAGPEQVDLLIEILTDVGGPELTGLPIERHPPDVAQAVGPYLRKCLVSAHEGIVLWNGVRLIRIAMVNVNPQH